MGEAGLLVARFHGTVDGHGYRLIYACFSFVVLFVLEDAHAPTFCLLLWLMLELAALASCCLVTGSICS